MLEEIVQEKPLEIQSPIPNPSAELSYALARIADGDSTEDDVEVIRQFLAVNSQREDLLQVGKYNVNIGQGQNIQIGDRIYQGADAETIREVIQAVLQENQPLPGKNQSPTQVWRYLHTLKGHSGAVNAVVISPDGKILVSGGSDRTIKIWHLGSMHLRHNLPKGKTSVESLAISPDGQTLVSGSKGGTVKVWELTTGTLRYTLPGIHSGVVTGLAIGSDHPTLFTASEDRTIKQWDLLTRQEVRTLQAGQTAVMAIALSPNNQWLASSSKGGTLRLWNVATGTLHLPPVNAHEDAINAILISPHSQSLLTASSDKTIKLWSLPDLELLYTFDRGQTAVNAMAIAPDTDIFVSGSEGGTIKFWNIKSRELLCPLNGVHFSAIQSVAIRSDSQVCVTSSAAGPLKVWQKKVR